MIREEGDDTEENEIEQQSFNLETVINSRYLLTRLHGGVFTTDGLKGKLSNILKNN